MGILHLEIECTLDDTNKGTINEGRKCNPKSILYTQAGVFQCTDENVLDRQYE
jgi:hypothetical protein